MSLLALVLAVGLVPLGGLQGIAKGGFEAYADTVADPALTEWVPEPTRIVKSSSSFPLTIKNNEVVLIENVSWTSTWSNWSPIKIEAGANATIIISGKVELRGFNGSGTTPGTAAINVPENSTLTIYGAHDEQSSREITDELVAVGGNAGNGTGGTDAYMMNTIASATFYLGVPASGSGGNGGGGAAAGIGGNGGAGGAGAKGKLSKISYEYIAYEEDGLVNKAWFEKTGSWGLFNSTLHGDAGTAGSAGSAAGSCGNVILAGKVSYKISGGNGGSGGDGGSSLGGRIQTSDMLAFGGPGGGGAGGGGLAAPAIGAGGAGGSGGGSGGLPGAENAVSTAQGGGGGGGAGGWPNGGGGAGGASVCTCADVNTGHKLFHQKDASGGKGGAAGASGSAGSSGSRWCTKHIDDASKGGNGGTLGSTSSGGSVDSINDTYGNRSGGVGGNSGSHVASKPWNGKFAITTSGDYLCTQGVGLDKSYVIGSGGGSGTLTATKPIYIVDLADCRPFKRAQADYSGQAIKIHELDENMKPEMVVSDPVYQRQLLADVQGNFGSEGFAVRPTTAVHAGQYDDIVTVGVNDASRGNLAILVSGVSAGQKLYVGEGTCELLIQEATMEGVEVQRSDPSQTPIAKQPIRFQITKDFTFDSSYEDGPFSVLKDVYSNKGTDKRYSVEFRLYDNNGNCVSSSQVTYDEASGKVPSTSLIPKEAGYYTAEAVIKNMTDFEEYTTKRMGSFYVQGESVTPWIRIEGIDQSGPNEYRAEYGDIFTIYAGVDSNDPSLVEEIEVFDDTYGLQGKPYLVAIEEMKRGDDGVWVGKYQCVNLRASSMVSNGYVATAKVEYTVSGDATNYTTVENRVFCFRKSYAVEWRGYETRPYDGTQSNVTAVVTPIGQPGLLEQQIENGQISVEVEGGNAIDAGDHRAQFRMTSDVEIGGNVSETFYMDDFYTLDYSSKDQQGYTIDHLSFKPVVTCASTLEGTPLSASFACPDPVREYFTLKYSPKNVANWQTSGPSEPGNYRIYAYVETKPGYSTVTQGNYELRNSDFVYARVYSVDEALNLALGAQSVTYGEETWASIALTDSCADLATIDQGLTWTLLDESGQEVSGVAFTRSDDGQSVSFVAPGKGKYKVKVTGTLNGGTHNFAKEASLEVKPRPISVEWEGSEVYPYSPDLKLDVKAKVSDPVYLRDLASGGVSEKLVLGTVKNAGDTGVARFSLEGDLAKSYTISNQTFAYRVVKAKQLVELSHEDVYVGSQLDAYDLGEDVAENPTSSAKWAYLDEGKSPNDLKEEDYGTEPCAKPGCYALWVHLDETSNYEAADLIGTVNVLPMGGSVSLSKSKVTYGEDVTASLANEGFASFKEQSGTWKVVDANKAELATGQASGSGFTWKSSAVGSYSFVFDGVAAGFDEDGNMLAQSQLNLTSDLVEVMPRDLGVSVGGSYTYDGTEKEATYAVSSGLLSGDNVSLDASGASGLRATNAGVYKVTGLALGGADAKNYVLPAEGGGYPWSIDPASIGIGSLNLPSSASPGQTIKFHVSLTDIPSLGENPAGTWKVKASVNDGELQELALQPSLERVEGAVIQTASFEWALPDDAAPSSKVQLQVEFTPADKGNYVAAGSASALLAQAELNVNEKDVYSISATYGDKPISLEEAVGAGELSDVQIVSGSDVVSYAEDAGMLSFMRSGQAQLSVRTADGLANVKVEVEPRPVTVTCSPEFFEYDGAEHGPVVVNPDGFIGTDDVRLGLSGTLVEKRAGYYEIEVSLEGTDSANYVLAEGCELFEWGIEWRDMDLDLAVDPDEIVFGSTSTAVITARNVVTGDELLGDMELYIDGDYVANVIMQPQDDSDEPGAEGLVTILLSRYVLEGLSVGTHSIELSYCPAENDNYSESSASAELTVLDPPPIPPDPDAPGGDEGDGPTGKDDQGGKTDGKGDGKGNDVVIAETGDGSFAVAATAFGLLVLAGAVCAAVALYARRRIA